MPNICNICNKQFSTSYGLKRHLNNSANTHKKIIPAPTDNENENENEHEHEHEHENENEHEHEHEHESSNLTLLLRNRGRVLTYPEFVTKMENATFTHMNQTGMDKDINDDENFMTEILMIQKKLLIGTLYTALERCVFHKDDTHISLLIREQIQKPSSIDVVMDSNKGCDKIAVKI